MQNAITIEQFKKVVPKHVKGNVSQQIVDTINQSVSDPIVREAYRENLLSYANVLLDGRFKLTSYLEAVRYVSYKLMGKSNIDAYVCAFPDRYQNFLTNGTSEKDINSYVTSYNKNKLVGLIMEQTLIPSYVMNQDLHQKALNVQAELMVSANSEKVRSDAANSILTHLKMPETQKVELDIGIKEDKTIDALRQTTMELVAQQRKMLSSGMSSAQDVAQSKLLIEGTAEEVDTED